MSDVLSNAGQAGEPLRPAALNLFSVQALKAGWYLAWRLGLVFYGFVFLGLGGGFAVGTLLGRPFDLITLWPLPATGMVVGVIVSIWLLNRLAISWAEAQYGRRFQTGIRWGIIWRGGLVNLACALVSRMTQGMATEGGLSPSVTLLAVAIPGLIISIQGYGWAMSVMVAKRLAKPED